MDLGPYLRGEMRRPEPSIGLPRSDGLRLLYPGKEHAVIGEMEAGKSWLLLACTAAEMAEDRPVLYAHFEESDPSDSIDRLLALGCPPWQIEKLFRFVGPERPITVDDLVALRDIRPSLVVLDGVNEAMSLHGQGIREEDGAAAFRRRLVKPFTAIGAAVLAADHVVKDVERRGRNALGSVHKGNGLSGSLIMLENADPFGRGMRGRSHVFVGKDRPGFLRRNGVATRLPGKTLMGELVVDDTQLSGPDLYLNFWAPRPEPAAELTGADGTHPDDALVLDVVRQIAGKGQANVRAVRARTGISKEKTDHALVRLVLDGRLVESGGARNARLFTVPQDQSSQSADEPLVTVPRDRAP